MFEAKNFPIPIAFNEEDVDIHAPRLFSDHYMLHFMLQMGILGMNAYSVAIALATRDDIYDYFSECFDELNNLHSMARKLLLSKGLYMRSPSLSHPDQPDYVKKKNFLTGWFGERRPLTALEITNLYANIQRNSLGKTTLMGFAQTAKSKEVKQYLQRGKDIADKHIDIFSSILRESELPVQPTLETEVTDNTQFVFSDKLMMFQVTALIAVGIGYYGASVSTSPRHDIGLHYTRLTAEIMKYAEDGAKLMIENHWLEEPPKFIDHDQLVNV